MSRRMSLREALEYVPDDLPDGAYWALAHEIAGADYGDAWDELDDAPAPVREPIPKPHQCPFCGSNFRLPGGHRSHIEMKHAKLIERMCRARETRP